MDHNEHVYDGPLGKALGERDGLNNLHEVILTCTGGAHEGHVFPRITTY